MMPNITLDRQRLLALLWGGVIALSMMRVWSSLFFTPIYVMALWALLDRETRVRLPGIARCVPMAIVYVIFAFASLFWAAHPKLALMALRGDVLIPLVAFAASYQAARRFDADRHAEFLLLGVWTVFLLGSLFGYVWFGGACFDKLFDSVGYYSSYLFMLSGMTLPYLNRRRRLLLYPVVAVLLFLTQQRVAWVVFPFIGFADLWLSAHGGMARRWLLLGIAAVLLGSVAMLKIVVEKKPVDALNPEVQASGLLDRLAKNERLRPWRDWAERGMQSPIVGHGFGRDNVKEHFSGGGAWDESKLNHGHNIVLNQFLQLGLLGVCLFLLAQLQLAAVLARLKQPLAHAALFVLILFFLRNLFDDFWFKRLLVVYALYFGWCLGGARWPTVRSVRNEA